MLIGVLISGCLWGVSCTQIWYYFRSPRARDDGLLLKALVVLAWLSDTTHQALISHSLYHYTVTIFGNREGLKHNISSLAIQTVVQEFSAFLVQCFYAQRIWKFSEKNVYLAATILPLIFAQLGLVIANTILNYQSLTFTELHLHNQSLTPACVAVTVATDAVLAISMCVLMHRKRSGISGCEDLCSTYDILDKLMLMTLGSGAVTSVCALAILITYVALPNSFVWIALFFLLGRLYINSLFVALNFRSTLRDRYSEEKPLTISVGGRFDRLSSPTSPSTAASNAA